VVVVLAQRVLVHSHQLAVAVVVVMPKFLLLTLLD
jgi:hypothetical protein